MKLHTHLYNRNEGSGPWWKTAQWTLGATIREKYHGSIAKGWWTLGPSSIVKHFEIEVALGGEDHMIQFAIVLPFLGKVAIGLRVPRQLVKPWVYHRREWTIRVGYVGRWVELLIASDEHMRDTGMVSYYREKRARGDDVGPWSRAALWPGWHLTFAPHPRDRLLGRAECTTTTDELGPVVVPMPEGTYPGTLKREARVWKRKRWPWPSRVRTDYWVDMEVGVPAPGKGENSWDCDDDAILGAGGDSPAAAVASVTRAALRNRDRYGSSSWTPSRGWPACVGASVPSGQKGSSDARA